MTDLCRAFEPAAADSAADCIAEHTVLDSIESERGYKSKRADHVQGFVVDLAKVVLSMIDEEGEEPLTAIIYILQSAAFDAEFSEFWLYAKLQ